MDFCYRPVELAQGPALVEALRADLNTGPPPDSVQLRVELDRTLSTANTDGYEHQPLNRLEELTQSKDTYVAGRAQWALGMRLFQSDPLDSRKHIVQAAVILDSSVPIAADYSRFLRDAQETRTEALPLLLFPLELEGDVGWPTERLDTYTAERASGELALATLKAQLQP